MTHDKEQIEGTFVNAEILATIQDILAACGDISLKEKVTMLYLSIDYIFEHNKELIPAFDDKITIH